MEMFQFLGRNSGRSDAANWERLERNLPFQFLGRNSGRSDNPTSAAILSIARRFQFLGRNSGRSDDPVSYRLDPYKLVSIPRSEFWSFGHTFPLPIIVLFASFNSSVGILVVRTGRTLHNGRRFRRVSIPRSEFWSFGLGGATNIDCQYVGFNSSVGILVVRTECPGSGRIGY